MKSFLTDFMRDNKRGHLHRDLELIFTKASQAVKTSLGPRPFHLRAGLNAPVFDAVFVAFAHHVGGLPEDIQGRYQRLLSDVDFGKWTRRATTDVEAVKQRIALARKHLFKE